MSEDPKSNIHRIAEVLRGFDQLNTPRSSREIIATVGMRRSTGFGLLRALVDGGWLERADHGSLRLGPKVAGIAFATLDRPQPGKNNRTRMIAARSEEKDVGKEPALEWDPSLVASVETDQYMRSSPYRIGFSNASVSNPWRQAMLNSMAYTHHLQRSKITSLHRLDAGDDPDLQIRQINTLVAQGVDLLIVSASSTTSDALSDCLQGHAARGLPIVAVDRRPKSAASLVSFVTASDRRIGRISALWLAEHLKGRGRIWMLSGREGTSPALRRQLAALVTFAEFPDLLVENVSYTDWTPESGHDVIARLLSEAGSCPDGVWCDSGLQGVGSIQRFLKLGLPVPAHTGGDLNEMYKLSLHNKVPIVALDYPARMGSLVLEVALDILAGRIVPRRVEAPVQVVLPRGCETQSVKADIWAETHVAWDLPGGAVLSQGPSLRSANRQSIPNWEHST